MRPAIARLRVFYVTFDLNYNFNSMWRHVPTAQVVAYTCTRRYVETRHSVRIRIYYNLIAGFIDRWSILCRYFFRFFFERTSIPQLMQSIDWLLSSCLYSVGMNDDRIHTHTAFAAVFDYDYTVRRQSSVLVTRTMYVFILCRSCFSIVFFVFRQEILLCRAHLGNNQIV